LLEVAGLSRPLEGDPDPAYLPEAAAAATALPHISGRLEEAVLARAAVVRLASAQLSAPQIAGLLATTERAVRRLRRLTPPPTLLEAIRVQALFRQAIDEQAR
jgi:hypothetical protein